jgi:hypothetical protein
MAGRFIMLEHLESDGLKHPRKQIFIHYYTISEESRESERLLTLALHFSLCITGFYFWIP